MRIKLSSTTSHPISTLFKIKKCPKHQIQSLSSKLCPRSLCVYHLSENCRLQSVQRHCKYNTCSPVRNISYFPYVEFAPALPINSPYFPEFELSCPPERGKLSVRKCVDKHKIVNITVQISDPTDRKHVILFKVIWESAQK